MRKTILAAGLAVLVGANSVGCKSTPKMSWWKTAGKDPVESSAVAHSAPQLPSEAAKQAEVVAATQKTSGDAAPFLPGAVASPANTVAAATSSTTYPNTQAPSFSPVTTHNHVASTATTMPGEKLGSLPMPYNPNAVPPAATGTVAAAAPPVADTNRYATTATPTSSLPPLSSETAVLPAARTPGLGGSRYSSPSLASKQTPASSGLPSSTNDIAASAAGLAAPVTATPETGTVGKTGTVGNLAAGVANATNTLGSRYAQVASSFTPTGPTTPATSPSVVDAATPVTSVPATSTPTTPTPATSTVVATANATPYRPGGTGSYPGSAATQPAIEVASRPGAPASEGSETPSTATPAQGEHSHTHDSIQPPRYR